MSLIGACITGVTSPPLDGGLGDHDHADSETDTAIPDDDDDIASLASQSFASLHQASKCLSSAPPGDLELENIFEDHAVSWQIGVEMSAHELETYRRCFPAQPALS